MGDAAHRQLAKGLVAAQRVATAKLERARELRHRPTAEEAILWRALRRGRWPGPPFRRQQPIDGFIVDFYCHAARLIVELDGTVHQQDPAYDRERDRILSARGLRVLRIPDRDIRQNLADVLARIAYHCWEGAGEVPSSSDVAAIDLDSH